MAAMLVGAMKGLFMLLQMSLSLVDVQGCRLLGRLLGHIILACVMRAAVFMTSKCVATAAAFLLFNMAAVVTARPQAGSEQKCQSGPVDLVFLIDGSRSVRPHEFESMRKFMIDILDTLDVGLNATRVGVVQYSSQVRSEFSLNSYDSMSNMVDAIQRMVPLAQGTMTGLAIRYIINEAFSEPRGDRSKVPNVAVIVTDGRPQDRVAEVAAEARGKGVEIFAVGVARADMASLRAMASPPFEDHVFLVETFDLIHQFGLQFQDKLCGVDLCVESEHGCEHICESSPGSFRCLCLPGYSLNNDGKTCTAIDLCAEGKHDCQQICVSSPGVFSCDCEPGFTLNPDNKTCTMLDFCAFGNHTCEHQCVSVLNGFHCACQDGYLLMEDGAACRPIDLCVQGRHDCQQICVSSPGVFTCDCEPGFALNPDNKTCTASDLCNSLDHGCEHRCVSVPGSYYCACPEGQTLREDGKRCGTCKLSVIDLVLLIDGSKSVRPRNFQLVKKFVNEVVDTLDVSEHGTRVGLVQYSSRVRTEFTLDRYHNADDVKAAVMKMEYMEKGTMTGLALSHMLERSFSEAEGARPLSRGIPRIGLVFTDGRSQDDVAEIAAQAKQAGITMYAVGVGKALEVELRQIASEPAEKHFFYASDFSAIGAIALNLKLNVCPEESQGEIEMKDPCACENLVEFQQATLSDLERVTQSLTAMSVRLERLEQQLLDRK
ncbi:matrilin-4 isoform X2 [Corythoichthys intestinalis]|uniref:matrilin-4 isoform X2 n=1 Tax=Corythoichthys intestinalis TaxID=161448 RepID=UPI0025A57CB3|nr:matrilin-4 isoform X2 [Corythoichthys intestinalis]